MGVATDAILGLALIVLAIGGAIHLPPNRNRREPAPRTTIAVFVCLFVAAGTRLLGHALGLA